MSSQKKNRGSRTIRIAHTTRTAAMLHRYQNTGCAEILGPADAGDSEDAVSDVDLLILTLRGYPTLPRDPFTC
ncbi:hypothetical protein GCM10009739_13380 [Microbacterium ulmi]